MPDPFDPIRRWLRSALDWCTRPNRPWWHLIYVFPVLLILLIVAKLLQLISPLDEDLKP